MAKKTLIIIIDNLERGGAETLLIGILREISQQYRTVLVTLNSTFQFDKDKILCDKYYSLNAKGRFNYFMKIPQLRRIVRNEKPDLIHTHLFYSTIVGRMVKPKHVPFVFTIHNETSKNTGKVERLIEHLTLRKNQNLIAVSKIVEEDYSSLFKKSIKTFVLYNYISENFFSPNEYPKSKGTMLRLIAIGNIKRQKNYQYLVNAFKLLKDVSISLDIYGNFLDPELSENLQSQIKGDNLPIRLLGPSSNISKKFANYDLFISCSSYEGFGLSVVEAMASGLPVLLSDIPVFREITNNSALFFDLHHPSSLLNIIHKIFENEINLTELSERGKIVTSKYHKTEYCNQLFNIYDQIIIHKS